MARWVSRTSLENRFSARFCRIVMAVVTLAAIWQAAVANAAPLLAQVGAGLVAPPLDQAAKPVNPVANVPGAKMAENFANAPAGGAPAAAAPASGAQSVGMSSSLMKYGPSYVLMALSIGLGTFIICRPRFGVKAK